MEESINRNRHLTIESDVNSHHTAWGSSDVDNRGECLLNIIAESNLNLKFNQGRKPTFRQRRGLGVREEVLDITLASCYAATKIFNWRVLDEPSASDHNYISFKVRSQNIAKTYRNPRRTDWGKFHTELQSSLSPADLLHGQGIDMMASSMKDAIIESYHKACPEVHSSSRKQACWWSPRLETRRRNLRRMYNVSKRTGNWERYSTALTEYNKEVRQAKRSSWREFCQSIDKVPDCAKLHKILAKSPTNVVGTVLKEDGTHTSNPEETLQVLLSTHFPGSFQPQDTVEVEARREPRGRSTREDWDCAKAVITYQGIKWALNSFQPYKSPGIDGVFPVLLQASAELVIPHLQLLFRTSLATGVIPSSWRTSRVVFIPKPGKASYEVAKSYRPISLTSFFAKTMEKVLDRHIRDTVLADRPLHRNQHAYQKGKSCETALHSLVSRIEQAERDSFGSISGYRRCF